MTVPNLVVEMAFAANPLDSIDAYLTLNGTATSYLATPDASALDITGDIDIAVRCSLNDWTPAAAQTLISKSVFGSTAFSFYVVASGALELATSANGSTLLTATSAIPAFTNGVSYWVRVTLDVNNGAGGRTYAFYTAPDSYDEPASWTLLSTTTVAGTTSIFNTTMEVEVGASGFGSFGSSGRFRRAILKNGIDGTTVADFDAYDMHTTSATTFGSSRIPGQTWIRYANAVPTITPTWTDVTSRVRNQQVSITRGKNNELQTFGSSSMSLTFDNRDRAFDPDYASSPFYPNVVPGKRIRVRAEYSGTRYDLWNGFVEEWPQTFAAGNLDAVVPIAAFDIMALAGETELRDAALVYMSDNSILGAAFREMVDGDWYDEIGGNYIRKRTGLTQTDTSKPAVGNGTPVLFNGSTWYSSGALTETNSDIPRFPSGTANTGYWSCWFKTTSTGSSATNWMLLLGAAYPSTPSYGTRLRIGIDNAGKVQYRGFDFIPGANPACASTAAVNDGAWHHLVVTQSGTDPIIYIDGRNVTDPTTVAANFGDASGIQVVGGPTLANASDTRFNGTIMDVFVGKNALTADQVLVWYQLARGYLVETASQRATRIVQQSAGLSTFATMTPRSKADVAAIDLAGSTVLAQLQRVADSEQGRLFADRYGRIRLDDRYWWQSTTNGRVSQATISDDGSDIPYANVTSTVSRREVQNDITVTGSNDTKFRATDSTSITTYGRRTGSLNTILSSLGAVVDMATGLVALRKNAVARTGAISVRPQTSPAQWPLVLELELADRVTFELMPVRYVASTSQYVRTLIIERIDWSITANDWTMSITGSPVPTQTLFRWGTSLLGGSDVLGY